MRAPTALTAAALATASALLLAACGGGGSDGKPDKIEGVPTGTPSTSAAPTAIASGASTTIDPALALPADLKLIFDWKTPADHAEAVALITAANFKQAMAHGVVSRNAGDSGLVNYATGDALTFGKSYVQQYLMHNWTITGTDRYYQPKIKMGADKSYAEVTFCNNQSKAYGKETKTGKILLTKESSSSYVLYDIVVAKITPQADAWQARSIVVKEKALQCKL